LVSDKKELTENRRWWIYYGWIYGPPSSTFI